jgi:hypothetical protein
LQNSQNFPLNPISSFHRSNLLKRLHPCTIKLRVVIVDDTKSNTCFLKSLLQKLRFVDTEIVFQEFDDGNEVVEEFSSAN